MEQDKEDDEELPLGPALLLSARASRRFGRIRPHQWVRALRRELRMTQAELARRAGTAQEEISRIEAGEVDIRLSMLLRLFEGLYCKPLILPHSTMEYDVRTAGGAWMTEKPKEPFDAYMEWVRRGQEWQRRNIGG